MEFAVLLLPVVALLWGVTNAMMKKSAEGIEDVKAEGFLKNLFAEMSFLIRNWPYLMAYGLNQLGSLLYYVALRYCDLSIAGPITNTLTFIVTYWAGKTFHGEKDENSWTKTIGLVCVCTGIVICIYDKIR